MTIAARAGVSSVAVPKVNAAYSLGASKAQVLRHVVLPTRCRRFHRAANGHGGVLEHGGGGRAEPPTAGSGR